MLVFVPSLSTFPTNTCSSQKEQVRTPEELPVGGPDVTSDLFLPQAVPFVGDITGSIQAARHLEGLDVLGRPHPTGPLSDDPRQAHLLLHVDLKRSKVKDQHHYFALG